MAAIRRLAADPSTGYRAQRNPLTVGFLGELLERPPQSLPPAVFLPTPFLSVSAAEVVAAMSGRGRPERFARLPYTIYRRILQLREGSPTAPQAQRRTGGPAARSSRAGL